MRTYTYIFGLIAFASVAMGDQKVRVRLDGPELKWSAEYEVEKEDHSQRMSFSRSNTFYFENLKVEKGDKSQGLPKDPESMVKQVNVEIVGGKEKKVGEKDVDCRVVAKNMVEVLMGHEVVSNRSNSNADGETRRYVYRQDQLPSALIARNLKTIHISRGNKSGYQCNRTEVEPIEGSPFAKEYARCGDLQITFKPRKSTRKGFEGKRVAFFNAESCREYGHEMSGRACETLVQVEACGLRYVQQGINKKREDTRRMLREYCVANQKGFTKADKLVAEQICEAPTMGLAQEFAKIANDELLERYLGSYKGVKAPVEHNVQIDADERIQCAGDCGMFQPPAGSSAR